MKIIIDLPPGSKKIGIEVGPSVVGEAAPSGLSVALVLSHASAQVLENTMKTALDAEEKKKPSLILLPKVP